MRRKGLTLLELLVVIAIIVALWALIFAALGPVRERARQAVCINNLKQIYQAIQMYRQDYHGSDEPGHYFEMGLPPSFLTLAKAGYLGEVWTVKSPSAPKVLICPNYPLAHIRQYHFASYWYQVCDNKYGGIGRRVSRCTKPWHNPNSPEALDFPERVRIRGDEYPLVGDSNHNPPPRPRRRDEPEPPRFVILMRLNGQVHSRWVPPDVRASWQL